VFMCISDLFQCNACTIGTANEGNLLTYLLTYLLTLLILLLCIRYW